jgi:transposase
MALHFHSIGPVPDETARVARAAFRKGNLYLRMRDDELFAQMCSLTGQSADASWHPALVCVLQYLENPSNRQVADALRVRPDWKYLLGLELTDPGFDASALSEFRT